MAITKYISEEARVRAEAALEFHYSVEPVELSLGVVAVAARYRGVVAEYAAAEQAVVAIAGVVDIRLLAVGNQRQLLGRTGEGVGQALR